MNTALPVNSKKAAMKYENTLDGVFLSRPNRFIAAVLVDGEEKIVHVKNTGRCKELLIPGTRVILQHFPNKGSRKTDYDLIAVYKGGRLINMDSQSPNKAAAEFIPQIFGENALIRPEAVFGSSRLDFFVKTADRKIYMEVKGVTLEQDGICLFPDAPTERGVKHLSELCRCVSEGYEGYILFVIQMKGVKCFKPNRTTHPAFADALIRAKNSGVTLLAYDCQVTEDSMTIDSPVEIIL